MISKSEKVKKKILKKFPFAKKSNVTWEQFMTIASEAANQYHFPQNIVICQATLETGRGKSSIAKYKNNYFGFMAYDADPGMAKSYERAVDSIIDYLELITKSPRYKACLNEDNPLDMITLIHKSGYATDPEYVKKITSLKEWIEYM